MCAKKISVEDKSAKFSSLEDIIGLKVVNVVAEAGSGLTKRITLEMEDGMRGILTSMTQIFPVLDRPHHIVTTIVPADKNCPEIENCN